MPDSEFAESLHVGYEFKLLWIEAFPFKGKALAKSFGLGRFDFRSVAGIDSTEENKVIRIYGISVTRNVLALKLGLWFFILSAAF